MLYELEAGKEICNCGNLLKQETRFRHRSRIDDDFYKIEIFEIFSCSACTQSTILCYSTEGSDIEDEQNHDSDSEFYRDYTRKVLYAPYHHPHAAIPRSIAEVIYQAQSTLAQSPRASFILCRSVLEEICCYFKIPNKKINKNNKTHFISLHERLIQLFKQEQISEELMQIIQVIKELGNEGTHSDHLTFSQQIKLEDVKNLLILVNHVVENLYVEKYKRQQAQQILSDLMQKIPKTEN